LSSRPSAVSEASSARDAPALSTSCVRSMPFGPGKLKNVFSLGHAASSHKMSALIHICRHIVHRILYRRAWAASRLMASKPLDFRRGKTDRPFGYTLRLAARRLTKPRASRKLERPSTKPGGAAAHALTLRDRAAIAIPPPHYIKSRARRLRVAPPLPWSAWAAIGNTRSTPASRAPSSLGPRRPPPARAFQGIPVACCRASGQDQIDGDA